MFKRTMAFAISCLMAMAIFASCSPAKNPQSSSGASTGDKEVSSEAQKPEEKYHYVLCPGFSAPPDEVPAMQTYWEEKLNATFELIYLEQAQYMELLNLRIASGKIPDVMSLQNISNVVKYKDDGVIGGFKKDFLQTASPATYKHYEEKYGEEGFDFVTYDGLMYSLPGGRHHNQFASPVIWNTGWLENVGITAIPKTLEETEKAFYAFRDKDPDKNGKKDTYGLSADGFSAIYGAFGVQRGIWVEDESGKLIYDISDPKSKEALTLLNKWYKDGIIDPEFVTGENKGGYWANSNAFCEGRIGFTGRAAYYHWRPQEISEKVGAIGNSELIKTVNPDLKFDFGFPPVGPNGKAGVIRQPYLLATVGFSKEMVANEGKMTKFLQMSETWCGINNIEDAITQTFGIKGTHWDYDENKTPLQKPDFLKVEAISAIGGNVTFQFYENPDVQAALNPVQYEWVSKLYAEPGRNVYYENKVTIPLPSDSKYLAEVKKVLDEGCIAIITGDKPIDYYDEIIKNFMAAGGETLTKEANEWYASRK